MPTNPTTWDELCAAEDCSQFPDGYTTWAVGSEIYTFPLYDTLSSKVAQVRMAQAAMANRDTFVSELCKELGVKPVTLDRYVDPNGNLRDYGRRVLRA